MALHGVGPQLDKSQPGFSFPGIVGVVALGDVPKSFKFDVAPQKCIYYNPSGVTFQGIVSDVVPHPGGLNFYELADRSWYARGDPEVQV